MEENFFDSKQGHDEEEQASNMIGNLQAQPNIKLEELAMVSGSVAMEREWRKRDNAIYEENKKWFMKEITDRDVKISQLQIDIRAKEINWKNSEFHITQQLTKAKAELNALEEKLETKEEALARVTSCIEKQSEKNRMEVKNLEADLKVKEDLTQLYKEQFERADALVEQLGEEIRLHKDLNVRAKELLEEVRFEREEERIEMRRELESKEKKILQLSAEISQLNEASKFAICLKEDELSRLFPSHEEFAKFLESGSSITSILSEQARLMGELDSQRERNQQLESDLKSVIEEIENSIPDYNIQREKLNELLNENCRLKNELQESEESRSQLESDKEQNLKQLAFSKAELEKYEKERIQSHKRIQRLLFVAERERKLEQGQKLSQLEERHLFDSIDNILRINAQLEAELISERNSISSRVLVEQNNELAILRKELAVAKENEQQLREQIEHINETFNAVQEQNKKIFDLTREDTTADQLREAKMKLLSTNGDLEAARITIGRLEATVQALQEEKKTFIEIGETRLTDSQNLLHELKKVNAKLEAKFEYQNQIAEANSKEMDLLQKEITRVNKENAELLKCDSDNSKKINELHAEILRINEEYGRCKVDLTTQNGELQQMRATNARLEAQLQVYQNRYQTDQNLFNSLLKINERLSRFDNEIEAQRQSIQHQTENTQNQSIVMEELEQMKIVLKQKENDLQAATEQISKLDSEMKALQARFEQARGLARKYRDELATVKISRIKEEQEQTNAAVNASEIERLNKIIEEKTNELTEATFRLNLLSSKVQKMEEARKQTDLELEKKIVKIENDEDQEYESPDHFEVDETDSNSAQFDQPQVKEEQKNCDQEEKIDDEEEKSCEQDERIVDQEQKSIIEEEKSGDDEEKNDDEEEELDEDEEKIDNEEMESGDEEMESGDDEEQSGADEEQNSYS